MSSERSEIWAEENCMFSLVRKRAASSVKFFNTVKLYLKVFNHSEVLDQKLSIFSTKMNAKKSFQNCTVWKH